MKTVRRILLGMLLVVFGAAMATIVIYTSMGREYANTLHALRDSEVTAKTSELNQYIEHYFVGDYDETALADAAADAMVEATGDRWSYYISAENYAAHKEQMANEYVGVGITIQKQENGDAYDVIAITPGGSAEEAGVQYGDVLVAVDGVSIRGTAVAEVRNAVRGEEGTTVVLTVERDGEPLDLTVERRTIPVIVAQGKLLDGGIGYVTITNFDANCADHTIAAIEELLDQGATSFVFDVRNNPGGYKSELVKVLDYLLPEGPLFRMKNTAGEESVDYSEPGCLDLPMAVLVNGDSYSAAEFFAAAIQEYGAGEVVGTQTCGKGYYQNTYELSDGSAVALSSGTYYTPNGVSLIGTGVVPDVEIDLSEEAQTALLSGQLAVEDDAQLQAAIELLRK